MAAGGCFDIDMAIFGGRLVTDRGAGGRYRRWLPRLARAYWGDVRNVERLRLLRLLSLLYPLIDSIDGRQDARLALGIELEGDDDVIVSQLFHLSKSSFEELARPRCNLARDLEGMEFLRNGN